MDKDNDIENIMFEEKIINDKLKKEKKWYKNPNSKTMIYKIKKLFKE